MIGQKLSNFELLELIGKGGFGEVYRARDELLGRLVAVKILPQELAADTDYRDRFLREARAASSLNHPNICTIHQFGDANGRTFIAMELIDGITLRKHIGRSPLPAEEAVRLALQIADGLAAAHDKGIVHRDIKSANILLNAEHQVKILDFGLAKQLFQGSFDGDTETAPLAATREGSFLGTIDYMSPEQLQGRTVDHRSDLFAFGVVCHEMLTGELPFSGDSVFEKASAILHVDPSSLRLLRDSAPAALTAIVLKMLARRPERRWSSAAEVRQALAGLAGDSTASAGRHGISSALERSVPEEFAGPSVAVLPFKNMSADPENEFFSDGLAEELTNDLAKVEGLKVASRTSAFAFKDKPDDVRQIGWSLGVKHIVEGSVRKASDRLRISVQMVNAVDGYHIWSETYDRRLDDIFALQDELARTIVGNLKVKLVGEGRPLGGRRYTDDVEAYNLYLKGRYFWNRRYAAGLQKGMGFFQQAIERDPAFALPYAGLADSFNMLAFYNFLPPRQGFPKGQAAAHKALELDPGLAEAHASLGWARAFYDWDWEGAERSFERALAIDPEHGMAHFWRAFFLVAVGRTSDSLEAIKRARQIEPLSALVNGGTAYLLYFHRDPQRAIKEAEQALEMDSAFRAAHTFLGWNKILLGDLEGALEAWRAALDLMPGLTVAEGLVGYCRARLGDVEAAREIERDLADRREGPYVSPYAMAVLNLGLGERDRAFAWLDRAYDERNNFLGFLAVDPIFDEIREDRRFAELMARVGVPQARVA
ncbi:MAG TPA: protein kinase [Thermoanaerobaculia bacterium]|nr:protein kinase [Thermoanaerobaculia bacterium]